MAFYNNIVAAYDEIFPLNKMQVSFIEHIQPVFSGKNMLDAGCGTGSLAIDLGRKGAAVKGFDLDATMIAKAVDKCPQALNVKFDQGDLTNFAANYNDVVFNVVCCFGNTLVHLSSLSDIEKFVSSAQSKIRPGGKLLIQIVNYDRVLKERVDVLPTISSKNYTFERFYSFNASRMIDFSTTLTRIDSGERYEQTVQLLPLKKDELYKLLVPYFTSIRFWGSFKREEWSSNSFHTIVEAVK